MTVTEKGLTLVEEDDEQEEAARVAYARAVGSRLRSMRKQMRLSLQAVEAMSEQEFKASVLGAYERGERAISVPRLQRLAKLYDVPVDQLLPLLPAACEHLTQLKSELTAIATEADRHADADPLAVVIDAVGVDRGQDLLRDAARIVDLSGNWAGVEIRLQDLISVPIMKICRALAAVLLSP